MAEHYKETLLASVKEVAVTLEKECMRLGTEFSSEQMSTQQEQTPRNAKEIQDCRALKMMHAQHVQKIDELRIAFETRLENQRMSIDTPKSSHDQELEKVREELGLSKREIAQQSKAIRA